LGKTQGKEKKHCIRERGDRKKIPIKARIMGKIGGNKIHERGGRKGKKKVGAIRLRPSPFQDQKKVEFKRERGPEKKSL